MNIIRNCENCVQTGSACHFRSDFRSLSCVKCAVGKRKCNIRDELKEVKAARERGSLVRNGGPGNGGEPNSGGAVATILSQIAEVAEKVDDVNRNMDGKLAKILERLEAIEQHNGMEKDYAEQAKRMEEDGAEQGIGTGQYPFEDGSVDQWRENGAEQDAGTELYANKGGLGGGGGEDWDIII